MTTLEINSNGQLFVIDGMPEDLTKYTSNHSKEDYKKYDESVASAPRILVSDQERAIFLIWQHYPKIYESGEDHPPVGIYQVPVEWEKINRYIESGSTQYETVAILKESPKKEAGPSITLLGQGYQINKWKESPKEESQERLWLEVQDLFFDKAKISEFMKRFILTRKK